MEFEIGTADALKIDDTELSALLTQVYVAGGYTEADEAVVLFEPSAVRKRGTLIVAREKRNFSLAGMVIVVPPHSPARRLAQNDEAEMHLLGVSPRYRRHGLGRMLVETAIGRAKLSGHSKIILWTQHSMKPAQQLYEAAGFTYVGDLNRNNRDFKVYELAL